MSHDHHCGRPFHFPRSAAGAGGCPVTTKRVTSRDVDCPVCGAPSGERCRGSAYSGRGGRTVDYHMDRRELARNLSAGGPPMTDAESDSGGVR